MGISKQLNLSNFSLRVLGTQIYICTFANQQIDPPYTYMWMASPPYNGRTNTLNN